MGFPVVTDSLDAYVAEVNRFPLLSRAQERELALHYLDTKDIDSAQKLVTSHLRFVIKVAMEYRNYGLAIKDLIQEGNLGLMNAVKKFNPLKGFRLITYAVWWIRSFIQEYILRTRGIVKRNNKALKKKLFYKSDAQSALTDGSIDNGLTTNDLSLNTPVGDNADTTYLEMLIDADADQAELIADREQKKLEAGKVRVALSTLNDKERFIVLNRLMSDDPLSLQKIGDKFGITRERVRQIEKASKKKLKAVLYKELPLRRPQFELPA